MSISIITAIGRALLPVIGFAIVAMLGNVLIRGNKKTGVIAYVENTATGETLALRTYETSIGRSTVCDIVLGYDTVSRFHAVIAKRNGKWILFDTNSKTGTFVNKDRVIKKKYLESGDTIIFGNAVFKFYEEVPVDPKTLPERPPQPKKKKSLKKNPAPKKKAAPAPKQAYYACSLTDCITGQSINIDDMEKVLIGRSDEANIQINRPSVSRYHALVSKNAHGRWMVEDLDSAAGTLFNGVPLKTATPLRDGDILEICGYSIRFSNTN